MPLTAVYMPVPEGYIGFIEEIPGANSQGETLDEVRENLREAVQLVLEANRELAEQALAGKDYGLLSRICGLIPAPAAGPIHETTRFQCLSQS